VYIFYIVMNVVINRQLTVRTTMYI